MKYAVLRGARPLGAVALLAVFLTAACGGGHAPDAGDHGTTPPEVVGDGFNGVDVAFAQNMIVHHEQAIEMAELADTRAADPELAQLAAQIRAAQLPEITVMTGWLAAWSQPVMPPGGHDDHVMPGMMPADEMAALTQATGVDFDRMFARMMIAHHNGAVLMARQVRAEGLNDEVAALAAAIEQEQADEVAQLEQILDRL